MKLNWSKALGDWLPIIVMIAVIGISICLCLFGCNRTEPTDYIPVCEREYKVEREAAFRFYQHPRMVITSAEIDYNEWMRIDIDIFSSNPGVYVNGRLLYTEPEIFEYMSFLYRPFKIPIEYSTFMGGENSTYYDHKPLDPHKW